MHLYRELKILTIRDRIHLIGSPCVNKDPYDFKLELGRFSSNNFPWEWWKNMIKGLSWRFHKCSGTFNMLTVEECSETVVFSEWSNQALDGCNFGNTLAMTIFFFLEMFKIWWRFHKWNQTLRKCFWFLR